VRLPLFAAALGLATACVTPSANPPTSSASLLHACPFGVEDTRIGVTDTENGFALLFTTARPSNVDELRERVRDQARANGPGRHAGKGHRGRHSGEHDHGLRLWKVGGVRVTVDDIPAGARLTIVPEDPGERQTVLRTVIRRVVELEVKGCPG
jgi:hypothetical protein